jgi:L-threonylcarbamoyladenylate synthase
MDEFDLSEAIAALRKGNLVVYPTDTLYALGADIYNKYAVRRVFEVKKRPWDVPLPVAVSSFDDIDRFAFVNERARCLADIFLPGPLTLVLKKRKNVPNVVTGGLDKIAVRIPDNEVALDLLFNFGPLTVTSANMHGSKVPYVIEDIRGEFKDDIAVYIDYKRLDGSPSTIVDITGKKPVVLREGTIKKKEILECGLI